MYGQMIRAAASMPGLARQPQSDTTAGLMQAILEQIRQMMTEARNSTRSTDVDERADRQRREKEAREVARGGQISDAGALAVMGNNEASNEYRRQQRLDEKFQRQNATQRPGETLEDFEARKAMYRREHEDQVNARRRRSQEKKDAMRAAGRVGQMIGVRQTGPGQYQADVFRGYHRETLPATSTAEESSQAARTRLQQLANNPVSPQQAETVRTLARMLGLATVGAR